MFLTGFSFGCLVVLFMIVWRDFRHLAVAKVFLLLLISSMAFVLRREVPGEWSWLAGDVMTFLPALFWLLCQLAFSRRPDLKSVWALLCLYSVIAPAVTRPFGSHEIADTALHWLGVKLPQFSEYAVICHGLWITAANWQDDLIASRRQLRLFLLVSVGIAGLCVTSSLNTGTSSELKLSLTVSICSLLAAYLLLRGKDGVLLGAETRETIQDSALHQKNTGSTDALKLNELRQQVAMLETLMDDNKFYRTPNLTLKMLSQEIKLPDYKVRSLINETFKYRNFNDYVNQLRIEEACQRLEAEPDTPIQNIALDVGYRTLSSFNRAFKEITDQTPSQYRNSKSYKK